MPAGGKIAPDGRPAQAPGVGKNARRHDLEAPATPGLSGTDLQYGDVQMLEQGQRVAPRPKKQQGAATPQQRNAPSRTSGAVGGMKVPDPIEFAAGRMGGQAVTGEAFPGRLVDPTPWVPLLEQMALRPNSGGALSANLMNILTQYRRRPVVTRAYLVDYNEMDNQIAGSL